MKYEYVKKEQGSSQYYDCETGPFTIVKAQYVKSAEQYDNGNPFIEALPRPVEKKDIKLNYEKSIPGYNREKQMKLSNYDKLSTVSLLRKVRFVLPFHSELEEYFNMALLTSYRERRLLTSPFSNYTVTINNEDTKRTAQLVGNSVSAANAGVTVLGYSGCGKSAALEILLSNYPQVINHTMDDGSKFTQIVYLSIVCSPNSNFNALYQSIAVEIDRALGNMEPVYERMIEKIRGLAQKADAICRLIEKFGIGCIILDEIQLIDFKSTKENSFEGLLTIVNKTKVALVTVGTEDAYSKIFPNLRTARRTGNLVNAKGYCNNKKYFTEIVKGLMQYQWFDEIIEPTYEMVDAFYDVSKGIIDQLVGVYMFMQIDYIRRNKKPIINGDYIHKIADKYYPGMQKLLTDVDTPFNESEMRRVLDEAEDKLLLMIDEAKQEEETNRLLATINNEQKIEIQNIKDNAIDRIQSTAFITGQSFTLHQISKAVDKTVKFLGVENISEGAVAKQAFEILTANQSNSATTKKPKAKRAKKGGKHHIILAELSNNMD